MSKCAVGVKFEMVSFASAARQRLLARAAFLYYVEGWTQRQIAEHVGVSRATAGRLVASARATGVVRIEILSDLRGQVEIELALESAYSLVEAVVVDSAEVNVGGSADLGWGCADMLTRRLKPGMTLALGWGSNPNEWIGRTAEVLQINALTGTIAEDLIVVQMAGAAPNDPSRVNPMRTVSAIADALVAKEILIAAPLYVDSAATVRGLLADRRISAAMVAIAGADICMFGIGHVSTTAPLYRSGYLDDDRVAELQQRGAVGDICGRFFDAAGRPLVGGLADLTLSVELDTITSRPLRVATAAGLERVEALRGAFIGGLANAVVTDTATALGLLQRAALPPHKGRKP